MQNQTRKIFKQNEQSNDNVKGIQVSILPPPEQLSLS
jgi:hypothetical protein